MGRLLAGIALGSKEVAAGHLLDAREDGDMGKVPKVRCIEVRAAGKRGLGIYAAKKFAPGEEVLTFHGTETAQQGAHTLQIGKHRHLTVAAPGKYINHSCDPNCGIKNKTTLVAIKPIEEGEEITFDYAMTELHIDGFSECLCKAKNCRGRIAGFDGLPCDIKKKYNGYFSDYLLESNE